jgi:hypothetical protein
MQLELDHDDGLVDDEAYEARLDDLLEAITQARAYAAARAADEGAWS